MVEDSVLVICILKIENLFRISIFGFRFFLPEKTRILQLRNYASSKTALGRGGPFRAVKLATIESTDT